MKTSSQNALFFLLLIYASKGEKLKNKTSCVLFREISAFFFFSASFLFKEHFFKCTYLVLVWNRSIGYHLVTLPGYPGCLRASALQRSMLPLFCELLQAPGVTCEVWLHCPSKALCRLNGSAHKISYWRVFWAAQLNLSNIAWEADGGCVCCNQVHFWFL